MIVPIAAATLVVLAGWRARPMPRPRARSRRLGTPARWVVSPLIALLVFEAPIIGVAAAGLLVTGRRWSAARRATRIARQVATDFPNALDLLVLTIRAGYLPAQAVIEIVPFLPASICGGFAAVERALNDGARFADALRQLSIHLGDIARPLVDSLSSTDRYGLPLAPVLERLSFEAHQQRRREADISARELPVRMAMPLVLCTLPSFVLVAIVPLLLGALSSLHV